MKFQELTPAARELYILLLHCTSYFLVNGIKDDLFNKILDSEDNLIIYASWVLGRLYDIRLLNYYMFMGIPITREELIDRIILLTDKVSGH